MLPDKNIMTIINCLEKAKALVSGQELIDIEEALTNFNALIQKDKEDKARLEEYIKQKERENVELEEILNDPEIMELITSATDDD